MTQLDFTGPLKNHYTLLRHGQSTANKQKIIVSAPENALDNYGLTSKGVNQVIATAQNSRIDQSALIVSSDFKRAHETAQVFASVVGIDQSIILAKELRERFFGEWELCDTQNYKKVWAADENSRLRQARDVESVESVLQRVLILLQRLEDQYDQRTIVLVGHGDVLQVTLSYFQLMNPRLHRSIGHMKNAQMRTLKVYDMLVKQNEVLNSGS